MSSFSQCSSSKKLDKKAPITFAEVYCQRWVGGVEGAGSGMNFTILADNNELMLDSVYFRGRVTKLEYNDKAKMYVGSFINAPTGPQDKVFSADPKEEYGNEMPKIPEKIPFELGDNECVVSYKSGDKTRYFKIENIKEKPLIAYPSAPRNGQ